MDGGIAGQIVFAEVTVHANLSIVPDSATDIWIALTGIPMNYPC